MKRESARAGIPFDKRHETPDYFGVSFSAQFQDALEQPSPLLRRFARLIEPAGDTRLEAMARQSQKLTRHHFGRTMRLFAPLYVSNECVNNCQYCGFSRDNPIFRTTLTVDQVVKEARYLHDKGFRNILLLAGEHPKFVSDGYLQKCLDALKSFIPTLAIEVGPMEDDQYGEIVGHGAEGLIVYQETYHRETYKKLHTAGPKKNFDWRLDCPERAYAGGFRRIGIGALFGLADWRHEALSLAAHLEYLYKHCWKASYSIAFPRMKPHAGNHEYTPDDNLSLSDRNMVQLMAAFRICFPQVHMVLSTRESAVMRDALFPLGFTSASAASKTDPGGYTGAGCDDLHLTVKGRRVELEEKAAASEKRATEQFSIDDKRSLAEVSGKLRELRLDPVYKDWDEAILTPS